jgi:uncharacterized membrane protein
MPEHNPKIIVPPPSTRLPFPAVNIDLPLRAPFDWLRLGWADLRHCGRASLFYGASFTLISWAVFLAFRYAVELVSGLTVGCMLIGPFMAIGLYALSRQREAGEPVRLRPTLTAWRTTRGAVGIYSLILIVLYLIWARASMVIFAVFYEGNGMPTVSGLLNEIAQLHDLEFILIYLLMGGVFAGFVFALSLVSIPLMLDRDQDAITAMIASVMALARNFPVALLWGALILLLIAIGTLTGFLGLAITGPWVGHATWHAYRALVKPLPSTEILEITP